ncbi:hypothetical protein LJE86_05395, partial [bacterium BMS3Abin03]|nr:hypothetical protein [bacterium BMS3Abin03]
MAVDIKELENWFKSRPMWLQDATHRIIQKGTLTTEDYEALFKICLAEANGEQAAFTAIPDGALEIKETT